MSREDTLSSFVKAYIGTLVGVGQDSDLTPEEREEVTRSRQEIDLFVSEVINSRETLTDSRLKSIEKIVQSIPEVIEDFLDDYYTRELVNAVPGYVLRTLKFSRMESARTPSPVTNTYLREATRAYIVGFPQACVALCRAALEQGLKENLGRQLLGHYIEFDELLKEARKFNLLDKITEKAARDIAKKANDVLHEKPVDLDKALTVLEGLRALLPQIYSAKGG